MQLEPPGDKHPAGAPCTGVKYVMIPGPGPSPPAPFLQVKPAQVETDTLVSCVGNSTDIGRCITEYAEAKGVDSVVVGARGLGAFKRCVHMRSSVCRAILHGQRLGWGALKRCVNAKQSMQGECAWVGLGWAHLEGCGGHLLGPSPPPLHLHHGTCSQTWRMGVTRPL